VSDKMTCPICDSYTSSVHWAVSQGEPCPYCGTSAALIEQINELRDRRGDEQLKTELQEALVRLATMTRTCQELRITLDRVREAVLHPTAIDALNEARSTP
jgi:hypothetical protein